MLLSAIVAMSRDGLIGKGGALPWRLPRDLKRFREITWGKPILMGRKTWASLGRPLPGRCNIVLTRDPAFAAAGAEVVHSPEEALERAGSTGTGEAVVIGGADIYAAFLDRCERIYLTVVEGEFGGETFFPGGIPGPPTWRAVHEESHPADEMDPHAHCFAVLKKNKPLAASSTASGLSCGGRI